MTLPRQEYVEGMVRLSIWYVRHLLTSGYISHRNVCDALTRRVNLYRLTSLWDGEHDPALGYNDREWDHLVQRLASLVSVSRSDKTAELEVEAIALLRPWLSFAQEPTPHQAFGCWTYELVGESIADAPGLFGRLTNRRKVVQRLRSLVGTTAPDRHAALHFFNAYAPESPFAQRQSVVRSLRALIVDCQHRYPAVQMLWCQSWLNSHASFLALFPETWRLSAVIRRPEDVEARSLGRVVLNTNNWWGQFMRSNGGFHQERARSFRESGGIFPLPNRLCHATLNELETYLEVLLSEDL